MKTTCPACGCTFDLEAGVNDADARRFADLVAGIHPMVAKPLIQYLALFRPEKTGLRWSRMLSLAQEIEPMIRDARITRNGTTYAAPREAWAAALTHLADRPKGLRLPLKSHGYLLEILASGAEKVAAKAEAQTEERRRVAPEGARSGVTRDTREIIERGDHAIDNVNKLLGDLQAALKKGVKDDGRDPE